jgi:DNA-binding CsgD family transcriptional regulator/tetratricopeptide (TPR) repeat protein
VPTRRARTFVGREAELAEIESRWREVCAGQAAVVLISGEAGVGKTSLVSEFASRILVGGGQVLQGSCVRVSTGGLPYGPIIDALRGLLHDRNVGSLTELCGPGYGHLDQLLHGDDHVMRAGGGSAELRSGRLLELVLGLLGQLAEDAPVLLAIEDIHWAEQSTLDLFAYLAVTLRWERVLLVVTYRDDEPAQGPLPSVLLALPRRREITWLPLAPMDREELAALLRELAETPLSGQAIDRIADLSGGNAFFAEELLAARDIESEGSLPAHVRDVVLLRVAALSEEGRDVVRVAAVVGREVSHALLAAVSGLPESALLQALRELVTHHILVSDIGDTYRFRHALTQEAVYSDLLPGERVRLHRLVATAMEEQPHLIGGPRSTTTAVIAHHWQAGGDRSKALAAAVAAGRAAAEIRGYKEGLHYFRRALLLWDEGADTGAAGIDRPDLLAAAAYCAHYAGEVDLAVQFVEAALAIVPPGDVVRRALLHEALGSYLSRAAADRSLRAFQEAHRLLAGAGETAERIRVTAALADALSKRGRYADSAPLWEETLALARAVEGCDREEVLGLRTSGWHLAMHGEPERGIARLRQALQLAAAMGDIEEHCVAYNHLSLALDFVGRSAECLATAEEALRWSAEIGVLFAPMIDMLDSLVLVFFRLGRWQQAEGVSDRILPADSHAPRAVMTRAVLAELATARGSPEDAEGHLKQAWQMLEGDDDPLNHGLVHAAAATRCLWLRQHQQARAEVRQALEIVGARGDDQQAVALCSLGVRVEADEAERRQARGLLRPHDDVLLEGRRLRARAHELWNAMGHRQVSFPEAALEKEMAEAEFQRLTGRSAAGAWGQVADGWERLARPYPAAYARWREAEALVGERSARAPEVLGRSHALARTLAAHALANEVAALARRTRIDLRTAPAEVPVRPVQRPFDLTDRELQVLRLLSTGSTNRIIARALGITESTASVHVAHILRKMHVRNRGAAAAAAHRLGLGDHHVDDRL